MKLQTKIPLLFLTLIVSVFLLITLFLYLNIRYYLFQTVSEKTKHIYLQNLEIIQTLDDLNNDERQIKQFLTQVARDHPNTFFEYSSKHIQQNIHVGKKPTGEFIINQTYPVKDQGELKIILQADLSQYGLGVLFHRTVLVFLALLLILFILLIVYFDHFINKPIHQLNQRLHKVKVNRKPLPPKYNRKDEIGELYQHVYSMEKRLYRSHTEQINIIASIAHDLKTPLTTIQGFSELLTSSTDHDPETKREYLQLIQSKAAYMQQLLDQFSSYIRNEYALLDMEFKEIKAADFFQSIAEEYEAELSGLGCTFLSQHLFSDNDLIQANAEMLRRVIANLIGNAIQHAKADPLTVSFTAYADEEMAHFIIEDNGEVDPEQWVNTPFTPWTPLKPSKTKKRSGMGLAICQMITQRHGGDLFTFRSTRHGGFGVEFTIPLANRKRK